MIMQGPEEGEERTICLDELPKARLHAEKTGRFNLYYDRTSCCATFFKYKALNMLDLPKDMELIEQGKARKEEVLEGYRKAVVVTMLYGANLCINIGTEAVDFENTWGSSSFPISLILDSKAIRERTSYMKLVRDDENVDVLGHKGSFEMGPTFTIGIIGDGSEGLTLDAFYESVPHADTM
jgi:hypothetical protein